MSLSLNPFLIIILMSLFLSQGSYAQSLIIKGRVIDENNTAISYASVGLKNHPLGTASSEEGDFQFIVPSYCLDDTLMVSAISYKTSETAIRFLKDSVNIIRIQPHTVMLDQVIVSSADKFAYSVVEKALKNKPKNYNQRKYQLQGFYRELIQNDGVYKRLTEATFTLEDRGFNKSHDKKIRLDGLRKSDDLREMDDLDIQFDTTSIKNDLEQLLKKDFIDTPLDSYVSWLYPYTGLGLLNEYDFILDSMVYLNDEPVYCISLFVKDPPELYKFTDYYNIYIRKKDYAIVEMNVASFYRAKSKYSESGPVYGKYRIYVRIKYRQYKNKWYPYYISRHGQVYGGDSRKVGLIALQVARENSTPVDYENVIYNGRYLDPCKNNFYKFQEILITNVIVKANGFLNIKENERMDGKRYVYAHQMEYDSIYWRNYITPPFHYFVQKAVADLEHANDPLKVQFNRNGKSTPDLD